MTSDLPLLVARLHACAVALPQAIEDLNETLEAIEDALNEFNLGVEASVPLGYKEMSLHFCRHSVGRSRVWRLFVDDGKGARSPLLNAARATRLTAVDRLPDLFDALRVATERVRGDLQDACRRLTAMADAGRKELPR